MENISITRKGVEKLANDINKRFDGELVTVALGLDKAIERFGYVRKDMGNCWFICVAGRLVHEPTTIDAINYLRRIKKGVNKK